MLIVAAGMLRSASTWQYQMACELAGLRGVAELLGYLECNGFTTEHAAAARTDRLLVVKMHPAHPLVIELAEAGHAQILYSYRDLRDVVYSLAHKIHLTPTEALQWYIPSAIDSHRLWTSCPGSLTIRYEEFVNDSLAATSRLADCLNVPLEPGDLIELDQAFSLNANRRRAQRKEQQLREQGCDLTDVRYACLHDHHELVHWNHVRNGEPGSWRSVATNDEIRLMGELCGDWLIANGYEPNHAWYQSAFGLDSSFREAISHTLAVDLTSSAIASVVAEV